MGDLQISSGDDSLQMGPKIPGVNLQSHQGQVKQKEVDLLSMKLDVEDALVGLHNAVVDSIIQAPVNQGNHAPINANIRAGGIEYLINNPGAPVLNAPNLNPNQQNQIPVENPWYNTASLVSLSDAFAVMFLALQRQKRLDKEIELKLANVSYQMSKESARLTIELGKMEMMEHIMKAGVQIAVGTASAGAAGFMPKAMDSTGSTMIATFEAIKGVGQAMNEAVGAFFAVPKAGLQAAKQLKDAVNQLILANKDSAAAASKESQDELNRILQQLSDIIQKFKDATKLVQG